MGTLTCVAACTANPAVVLRSMPCFVCAGALIVVEAP